MRIRSTSELDNIESKSMCVNPMTKKVEVSFAEECRRLLDLHDEVDTEDDKKNVKREAKASLKQK